LGKINEKIRYTNEESKELDYDENKDQLEEEQEEQTGEMTLNATANQVFLNSIES
jgi:hypothetical protein